MQALCDYITPGKPHSMFGHNQPRDVTLRKGAGDYFGFTLRGSFPPFVVSIDPGGLAHKNVSGGVTEQEKTRKNKKKNKKKQEENPHFSNKCFPRMCFWGGCENRGCCLGTTCWL